MRQLSFAASLVVALAGTEEYCRNGDTTANCRDPHTPALLQVSNIRSRSEHELADNARESRISKQEVSIVDHIQNVNKISGQAEASPPFKIDSPDSHKPHFKILGNYGTGTHLIRELIVRNFGEVTVSEPNFCQDNVCESPPGTLCGFWKHSSLALLPKARLEECNHPNIIGVAMIRNPLSWFGSLSVRPWDLKNCVWLNNGKKNWPKREDWLTRPCEYPATTPEESLRGVTFTSLAQIWNNFTDDYASMSSSGHFKRSLVIKYEDLVINTDQVLAQLAVIANLSLPVSTKNVDEHVALVHAGRGNNDHSTAAKKIQEKRYLKDFSDESLKAACANLNKAMMHRFDYMDCDPDQLREEYKLVQVTHLDQLP